MFGALRLFLAILVVYTHLGPPHGAALGHHAVFGFYLLSGFLITRILNDLYDFDQKSFWSNRFLRLYPIYFTVIVLTIPLILYLPAMSEFVGRWRTPEGIWPWVQNFLLVPIASRPPFRLVPISWSVAVEIVNYGVLAIFTARKVRFAWIALAVAAAYHAWSFAAGLDHDHRYFPWYAAALPFSLGALTYFYNQWLTERLCGKWPVFAAFAGILVAAYMTSPIQGPISEIVFYLGLVVFGSVVMVLNAIKAPTWDKFLGDLAYPVFVVHYLVGALVHVFFGLGQSGGVLFLVSMPAIIVCSVCLALLQSQLIEPFRDIVRARAKARLIAHEV